MVLRIADRWFEWRRIDDAVTLLWEPHVVPLMRCNIWHVRGRDRDLLIDTGMGIASLKEAALYGLSHLDHWREANRVLMGERVAALRAAFAQHDTGYELVSAGAYFAYLRHPFRGTAAREVAKRLAEEENMLCLPGGMFGAEQEDYLRFAFANVEAAVMPEIARRLARSARRAGR